MSVPLRPILPRVQDDDGGHRKRSLGPKQMPAKRSPVLAACDGCRAKRIKCDGERPTCSQCEKRKSSCSYRAQPGLTPFESLKQENKSLKSQSGDLLRFIDLLKASPGAMCLDMVDQLRDGATPACLLARLDLAVETLAASAMAVASVVEAGASGQAPSDLAELELALVTRHPRAFSPLSPPDVSSLDLRLVGVPCMTNVPRWTHSWGLQERDGVLMDTSEERPSKRQRSPRDDSQHSPTKGPTPPSTINPKNILQRANVTDGEALYVDARLDHLSLRQWTKVSVSDRFVAAALSLFLRNEHPLVACFDEDLFLRDFSSGGTHYCSPLLVNALLAFACYSYTPIEAQAAVLRHKFFAEAESLWKLEWETPSLTGVSAAILMKLACDNSGDDELGLFYLTGASTMAGHLHVLDGSVPAQTWDEETTASAVAWGLFNGQSLHAINFPQASLVKKPPSLPMRGAVVTGADGEPRTVGRPLPSYMGHTALVASKFWLIIHEANHQIETNGPLLLPAVMEFYHELLAWADDLPTDTARSDSNPHHVLTMHIWYHAAILDLLRPFICNPMAAEETPSHDISILIPKAAFKASVGQIKDLLYLYRSRYEDTNPTMLNHTGMIHVLYELFRDGRATDTYFYFLLCIHGYLELGRCMPVAGKVMRDIHRTGTRMGSSLLEASSNLFESIQTSEASIGQRAPFTGSGRAAAAFQAGVNIGGVEVAHEQHPLELRSQQDHDNQQQQQHQHFQKKPNWPQVVYMPSDMSTHFRGSRQLRLGTVEVDGDDEDVQTVHRAAQSVSHVDLKVLGGHGAARQGSGRGITHMQDPGPRVWKGDPRSLQETLSDGQMYHDL